MLCRGSLEGIHWSISGGNKLSSIMIDYGSPHQIVCCTMPTRPNSKCSVCSMITNDQGVGVLYTNVMCAVASAQSSYLESTYGERARARSSRLRTYQLMNTMNTSWTTESGYSYAHQSYLQVITNVQLRQKISRFRCSNHRLEVECGRHVKPKSVPRRDRVCRLCSLGAVEDEDHLLLVCPAHHDIRCKFGQQLGKQSTPCSLLTELMCSADQKAVALYIVSCLDNRSVLLKSTM